MTFYWERHPDGPFVTLISIVTNYLHPEIDDLDLLKERAKHDDDRMRIFKSELREALRDPDRLPDSEWYGYDGELFASVQYENGCDEAFLVWLWHELYGDERFDASALTRLKALPEPFAERLHWQTRHDIGNAARASEWGKALELPVAGLAESSALVSQAEHDELAALRSAVGQPAAAFAALGVGAGNSPAPAAESTTPSSSADA